MFSCTLGKYEAIFTQIFEKEIFFSLLKIVISPQSKMCILLLRHSGMLKLESSLILSIFSEIYVFFSCFLCSFNLISKYYGHCKVLCRKKNIQSFVLSASSSDIFLFCRIGSKCNAFSL